MYILLLCMCLLWCAPPRVLVVVCLQPGQKRRVSLNLGLVHLNRSIRKLSMKTGLKLMLHNSLDQIRDDYVRMGIARDFFACDRGQRCPGLETTGSRTWILHWPQ